MSRLITSVVMAIGILMLASDGATLSNDNGVNPSISASGPSRSRIPSDNNNNPSAAIYNTIESEALMDYIESLPRHTIKKLLDDDELTEFVSIYENQIFDQETVFVRHSDYKTLRDAVEQVVTPSEMSGLLSLFTFNVSVGSDSLPDDHKVVRTQNDSSSANSTEKPEYPDYDICPDSFKQSSLSHTNYSHLPPVKTIVRMEHVITHPMIQIYATNLGLARILKHPNLLHQVKTKKNKLLNVLFLDMSLISLLESKITCYKLLTDDSIVVRFSVAFGKTLNAMELSAIPSYFDHISQFTARALNKSSVIVELKDRNYTSPVIEVDRENRNPCLFFNLLSSCENGGICVGFTGVGNCRCPEGFKGKFCHSKVNRTIKKSDSDRRRGLVILSPTVQQNVSHSLHRELELTLVWLRKVTLFLPEERRERLRHYVLESFREELFRTFRSEFGFSFRVESTSGIHLYPLNTSRLLVQFLKKQMGASKAVLCEKERNLNIKLLKENAHLKKKLYLEFKMALSSCILSALFCCIVLIFCSIDCEKYCASGKVSPVGPVPPAVPVGLNAPVAPNSVRHSFA